MNKSVIGDWGEDMACEYIQNLGYRIVERNFHSKFGEIDIIAKDNNCLVFIEVKTRKNNLYGNACEFVDIRKQQKIIKTAQWYVIKNPEIEMRFDVVEVYYSQQSDIMVKKSINHIKNAFMT